ncbi:MAG: hypothetical protein ABI851_12245 [Saprospiraceae bacterium]
MITQQTELEEGELLKERNLLCKEDAAKILGMRLNFFNSRVAPHTGISIGSNKYYTRAELGQWLDEKLRTKLQKVSETA